MKLIKDIFLVRADKNLNKSLPIKGHDGNPLFLDTDFNNYEHSTQIGEIAHVPSKIDEEFNYDNPLRVGDSIVFHHFVVQPDNSLLVDGEEVFKCHYRDIWCKIEDEKIMPIEDFIFVEPILEPEESMYGAGGYLLKTKRENLKNQGIVFAASKSAKSRGVLPGDKVFFNNDADYDIKIGKLLWRMRIRNIIAIERNGEINCLSDKIMAKEIKDSESLMPKEIKDNVGVVLSVGDEVKGIRKFEVVSFFHGLATKLNYKGEDYAFIDKESINYVVAELFCEEIKNK